MGADQVCWLAVVFFVTPGASSRRLRRLKKIRDATAEAIQNELSVRREAYDSGAGCGVEAIRLGDVTSSSSSSSTRRRPMLAEVPLGGGKTVYHSDQKDKSVQTPGPAFAPAVAEVRTEVRRELQVPERVHVVPGNQCFHLFNPCHAFRHRGTEERVQSLRICEYCVRHAGQDPRVGGPSLDDILRSGNTPNFDRPGVRPA